MDRWYLIIATVFAVIAGLTGLAGVRHGLRSRATVWWMVGVLVFQVGYLSVRGEMRGACPLRGLGEIAAYLAWALTVFYLLVGPAYRISLLGMFSAPLVVIFQLIALIPGNMVSHPVRVASTSFWGETHSATSVLAYGALALAAVAGVMFLMLDRLLKDHHLQGGLFRNLPPVRELLVSLERLLWIGLVLLTAGVVAGFLMPRGQDALGHLIAAVLVWASYVALMVVKRVRGLTGRKFALMAVLLFVLSLGVFAFV